MLARSTRTAAVRHAGGAAIAAGGGGRSSGPGGRGRRSRRRRRRRRRRRQVGIAARPSARRPTGARQCWLAVLVDGHRDVVFGAFGRRLTGGFPGLIRVSPNDELCHCMGPLWRPFLFPSSCCSLPLSCLRPMPWRSQGHGLRALQRRRRVAWLREMCVRVRVRVRVWAGPSQ